MQSTFMNVLCPLHKDTFSTVQVLDYNIYPSFPHDSDFSVSSIFTKFCPSESVLGRERWFKSLTATVSLHVSVSWGCFFLYAVAAFGVYRY